MVWDVFSVEERLPKARFAWLAVAVAAPAVLAATPLALAAEGAVDVDPADAGPPELEPESVDEVVVTASRVREEPFESTRAVDVISSEKIVERQPRTTPEALAESTGAFVQHTNLGGGSPIVRGLVGPRVLLLIDGVRLNNSVFRTGPLQYLNLIDIYQVERLEIVRGPGSVLYGSDALGATIQAVLRSPRDRRLLGPGAGGRLLGRFGSAAREKTGHAEIDAGGGWLGVGAGATARDFEDLRGGGKVGVQPHSGYQQVNTSTRLTARLSEGAFRDWRLTAGYHAALMNDVGRAEKLDARDVYDTYWNRHHLALLRGEAPLRGLDTELELTLSYQRFFERKDHTSLTPAQDSIESLTSDRVTVDTLGADLEITTRLIDDRLRLTYGGEAYRDAVGSSTRLRDGGGSWHRAARDPYPEGARAQLAGTYAHARGELLPRRLPLGLALTAGARFQQMGARASAEGGDPAVRRSDRDFVLSAGAQLRYEDVWNTALTWNQGFRAPNLMETALVGDAGTFYHVENSRLGPERSDTIELLTRLHAGPFRVGISGYASFLSDLIKRVPAATDDGRSEVDGSPVVWNANGGEGRIFGVEGETALELPGGLELHGSLTWTYGYELLDGQARAEDESHRSRIPLSRIPPLFGDAGLRWSARIGERLRGWAGPVVLFAGRQDRLSDRDRRDIRIPEGGTPGWVVVNLRAGVVYRELVGLSLAVENVGDARYKYHGSGIHAAGTNGLISLELRH